METVVDREQENIGKSNNKLNIDPFLRRSLDIMGSVTGLILLLPFFFVIAIAIKRDTPGPVFYRGRRTGKGGKEFGILKFRTMYESPASYAGPKVTAAGDNRITPLGKWLRDSKVNELPQLWNVLIGNMALVGPRPEDPDLEKAWPKEVRDELLSVRPGITSPATVLYRGEEELLSAHSLMDDYLHKILPDKLRIDRMYLKNRTFLTDIDVLLMTVALLLPYIKHVEVSPTFLYWGPLSRFTSRLLNWFLIDVCSATIALGVVGFIWRLDFPLNYGVLVYFLVALGTGICFSFFNYLFGLQRIEWRRASASEVIPLAFSASLTIFLLEILSYAVFQYGPTFGFKLPKFPSTLIITGGMVAFIGFMLTRYKERVLTGIASRWLKMRNKSLIIGERVLLIGAGVNSQFAIWLLTRDEMLKALNIVGIVDDDPRKQGMTFEQVPVLGVTNDIPKLVKDLNIGLIVYTISNINHSDRSHILDICKKVNVPMVLLPDVMEDLLSHFKVAQNPLEADTILEELTHSVS